MWREHGAPSPLTVPLGGSLAPCGGPYRDLFPGIDVCRGPASAGLRVPEGWTAQAKNEGSDTKFDAGEWPALVGLTKLSEFSQALFL